MPDTSMPGWRKRPSIYMPRWASRILLEIVSVRVERLKAIVISDSDVIAEGIRKGCGVALPKRGESLRETFSLLWDSLNAKRGYPWAANPFVWRIEFRRVP